MTKTSPQTTPGAARAASPRRSALEAILEQCLDNGRWLFRLPACISLLLRAIEEDKILGNGTPKKGSTFEDII
jgi:hypothetical protein